MWVILNILKLINNQTYKEETTNSTRELFFLSDFL